MKILATLFIAGGLAASVAHAGGEPESASKAPTHPQVGSHVMFLYYKDIAAAERFYSDAMGLKKTYDKQWVKMFQVTENSYVGLVDETQGYHKAPVATPPVMLSIETTDLEGWQKRLKAKGATFVKELDPNGKHPLVNSILLKDPAGYTVEFFRWKAPQ
jgi:predicted enzyme related to lactoylglutathione lyase